MSLFEFQFNEEEGVEDRLKSGVFQALGSASMCWDHRPSGVFDSERAEVVGNKLIELINWARPREPQLGLATTKQIINELYARVNLNRFGQEDRDEPTSEEKHLLRALNTALEELDNETLGYRTVDS